MESGRAKQSIAIMLRANKIGGWLWWVGIRGVSEEQLACDLIAALPEAEWIAGKITQYGHGVCAQNGEDCDCAPDEHICAISWELRGDTGQIVRAFCGWRETCILVRTSRDFARGMPLLREASA
jgi:hypothetical protein